jgi:hypothetical protein
MGSDDATPSTAFSGMGFWMGRDDATCLHRCRELGSRVYAAGAVAVGKCDGLPCWAVLQDKAVQFLWQQLGKGIKCATGVSVSLCALYTQKDTMFSSQGRNRFFGTQIEHYRLRILGPRVGVGAGGLGCVAHL